MSSQRSTTVPSLKPGAHEPPKVDRSTQLTYVHCVSCCLMETAQDPLFPSRFVIMISDTTAVAANHICVRSLQEGSRFSFNNS